MDVITDIFNDHNRLVHELRKAISPSLPGQEAQYLAVPPNRERTNIQEAKANANTRRAAVMALLYPKENITHIALIKRNEYPGVHSGQISFPGGKEERSDSDLLQTAYRETVEEIGVPKHHYKVWLPLTEVYIPPSQFLVQPYVGIAEKPLQFVPEAREVVEILQVPLQRLYGRNAMEKRKMQFGDFTADVPTFPIDDHVIWGATAMMISELMVLIDRILDRG